MITALLHGGRGGGRQLVENVLDAPTSRTFDHSTSIAGSLMRELRRVWGVCDGCLNSRNCHQTLISVQANPFYLAKQAKKA